MLGLIFLLSSFGQASAQISLPILADPRFRSIPGETLVRQQLSSWGISIGPIDLSLHLRRDLPSREIRQTRECRRSRRKLDERGGLNLDIGLGLGLHPTFGASISAGAGASSSSILGLGLHLGLGDKQGGGWGQADNVARGEKGDTEWFTYITLGTPAQSVPVLPDTGSSDLWVFGPSCTSCDPSNHTEYIPSSSSSYHNLTSAWQGGYADGSVVDGYASSDALSFGSGTIVQTPINFAVAQTVDGSGFASSGRSGIMGIGLDNLATMPVPSSEASLGSTMFSRLVRAAKLKSPVLGVRLDKGQQSQGVVYQEGSGQYTFGGMEDNYIVGGETGITWSPVTSSNYWGFTMSDISYGALSVLATDNVTPRRAIIDTGTTLIITTDQAASAIHALITGAFQDTSSTIWYIPCDTSYPTTQNVFFTIANRRFGVPIGDLAWAVSDTYAGMCVSGIQGGMSSFTILGDMFIKNHYVVLSYGSKKEDNIQVGLADRTDIPTIL